MYTIIGNRGSKSRVLFLDPAKKNIVVKEQRVDGSYRTNLMRLRYSLTGYKISYQTKPFSKQINKVRSYTSLAVEQAQTELDMNP